MNNKEKPPIAKNMPPSAGKIAWSRSIFERVKIPIQKLNTWEDLLTSPKGKEVALRYYNLAKKLEKEYEETHYLEWKNSNTQIAISLLKEPILKNVVPEEKRGKREGKDGAKVKVKDSIQNYVVNFSPVLKVIIREAKYLDRVGMDIPQTIINIAL